MKIMKKLIMILSLMLSFISILYSQSSWPPPQILTTAPSGACAPGTFAINLTANTLYYCASAWELTSGGSGGGTVTSFSSGNLSPLLTTSVATPTTTPVQSFSLTNASAYSWFGNATSSAATPGYNTSAIPYNMGGTGLTSLTANDCLAANSSANGYQFVSCGSGGSGTWSSLGNPSANLTLNMAAYSTIFDSTLTSSLLTLQQTTAATSSANVDSPAFTLGGNIYLDSASTPATWSMQEQPGTGSTPASNIVFSQSGATGGAYAVFDSSIFSEVPAGQDSVAFKAQEPSGYTGNPFGYTLNGTYLFEVNDAGDVSIGTWNGSVITYPYGGTGLTTLTANDCLAANSTATGYDFVSCGSGGGGLPANWSQNSTTGTVTGTTATSEDAPITQFIQQVDNGTSDWSQWYLYGATPSNTCSTNADCVFSIGPSGMYTKANNITFGTVNQSTASYNFLWGGTPGQAYLGLGSAALNAPSFSSADLSTATTGGSLPASTTYDVEIAYTTSAGVTTVSSEASIETGSGTATNTITITSPAYSAGSNGWDAYVEVSGTWYLQDNEPIGTNLTLTSIGSSGAQPVSSNTSGGAYIDYLSMSAEGLGLCVSTSVPGNDCTTGTVLATQSYAQSAAYPVANTTVTVANDTTIDATSCVAQTAITMSGLTTGMTVTFTATSNTATVTGWGSPSAGLLYITDYPSTGSLNWEICNNTSSNIETSAAVTFNVGAR